MLLKHKMLLLDEQIIKFISLENISSNLEPIETDNHKLHENETLSRRQG